jgi:flagellar biosynthetic protein FliR
MHAELTFQLATLYGFLLALARVSGVVVFVPIPGFSAGPDASRVVLALALTIALFPAWPTLAPQNGPALPAGRLLGMLCQESLFGVTVGLAVSFLLEGLQLAAQVLGLQAGYSYASTVDPSTQADTTTLQLMAQLLAGMLFFTMGFDRQVLQALAKNLETSAGSAFSLAGSVAAAQAVEAIVRLGTAIFSTGLQLAMPVLALLVLLDIAFAVLGRLHAQLQLLSLSFAIKMLTALTLLAGVLSVYPAIFERSGRITFAVLDRVLNP